MTIDDLVSPSGRFRIESLRGSPHLVERLEEMGFFPGTELGVSGRLPFKGPWVVHLGASSFALRADEARAVVIQELPS